MSFIRETHGDDFKIEVAAYPEMHPQAPNASVDFENFRRKVEAGADAALTQLFYNADAYFDFMERCEKAGIRIPVVPGIMPITGYANTLRFCAGCGADLPRWVQLRLEELQDDKAGLLEFGLGVVTRLCESAAQGRRSGTAFLHRQPGRAHAASAAESGARGSGVKSSESASQRVSRSASWRYDGNHG